MGRIFGVDDGLPTFSSSSSSLFPFHSSLAYLQQIAYAQLVQTYNTSTLYSINFQSFNSIQNVFLNCSCKGRISGYASRWKDEGSTFPQGGL